ncbi:MAG: DDE-type integrase/transposase/recombinase [Sedimenticola sp.]
MAEDGLSNWTENLTKDEIRADQESDGDMGNIYKWKQQNVATPPKVPPEASRTTKRYLGQWDQLQLIDGILYRRVEEGDQTINQLLVPSNRKLEIMQSLHKEAGGGHLGIAKVCAKLKCRCYWSGWQEDVEIFCKECLECGSRKSPTKHTRAPMVANCAGSPMEKIALDILGPLPTSKDGNRYILVISDYFTKWTEAYALPNHRAKTVAKTLVDEFICRYGAPMIIHSDQGSDFESKLFKEVCVLLAIKKTRTTPYHPQSDGQVERFNRTLLDMLSKHVQEDQTDWDIHIPHVMMAYRSSEQDSTKFSPAMLMFGHELRLPIDVIVGDPPKAKPQISDYASHLRTSLNTAFKKVRDNLEASHKIQKDTYDVKVAGMRIEEGDDVWLHSPAVKVGRTTKLNCPWEGPYTVLQKMSDVTYKIKRAGGRKEKVVHYNRLKPYNQSKGNAASQTQIPNLAREQQVVAPSKKDQQPNHTAREQPVVAPREAVEDYSSSEAETVAEEDEPNLGGREGVAEGPPIEAPIEEPHDRRPPRVRRPPGWLQDYVTDEIESESDAGSTDSE